MNEELENIQSETEIIDWSRKNGFDFEKNVVKMLNPKYYTLQEWRGDKFVNGRFSPTNYDPDIIVRVNLERMDTFFAIECKWRTDFYNGCVRLASDRQLDRYRRFQKQQNIPVYFVLGIGGTGEVPREIYAFPLDKVKYSILQKDYIARDIITNNELFYDLKTRRLS